MTSNMKYAIGVTIAAVLIFAAAFMPWGTIRGTPNVPFVDPPFQGMERIFTITGWNGNITPGALTLPNWLVVLAAASLVALCWLKAAAVWDAPSAVLFALAGYGLFHVGFALVVLMRSENASAGVGSSLTALAFVGILVILIRQNKHGWLAHVLGLITFAGLILLIICYGVGPEGLPYPIPITLLASGAGCFFLAGIPWAHTRGLRGLKAAYLGAVGFVGGGVAGALAGGDVGEELGRENRLGMSILGLIGGFWVGAVVFAGIGIYWAIWFHRRYDPGGQPGE
jgi:hypothetical protein